MRLIATAAVTAVLALTASPPAHAGCNLKPGHAAEVAGDVAEAWLARTGVALYKVETDELTCDAEVAYLFDPRGTVLCAVGRHIDVRGTYEPEEFDFTGSGYWVRIESVQCR